MGLATHQQASPYSATHFRVLPPSSSTSTRARESVYESRDADREVDVRSSLQRDDRERGLFPGEPETCRRDWRRFAPVMALLGLLIYIFSLYQLEGRAFRILATTAALALPIHYALPYRWKKSFCIAASIMGLIAVYGWEIGVPVLAAGLGLIGVARAPISWGLRASLIGLIALALGLARPWAGTIAPSAIWPILGSVFMFRMVIYMYELRHARDRESFEDALSYFFLLPNYCFIHFPVVDYRTMQRGYFSQDIHEIQREGLRMILRGVLHLLAYRVIYHELLIAPGDVNGPWDLTRYLTFNYLLYLRVSGQFHMACGMLHLFGYKLPETHRNYLLASSFTDYWRRINIYWKDFMVRVVFNPIVFALKRRPQWQALALATVAVFGVTWLLHAYQSFWLRGTWGFSATDALFWGILGAFVLINVQWDAARSSRRPARSLKAKGQSGKPSIADRAVLAAKTMATFVTIAMLWSLWCSPTLTEWLETMGRGLGLSHR